MAELRRRYHGSTIHDGRDIGKRRRARVAPATNTLSWLVPLWFVRRGRQMQKICLVSRRATSSDKWLALRPPGRGAYQPPCGGLGAERRRVGSALDWWVVTEKLQLSAARPLHMPPIYSDTIDCLNWNRHLSVTHGIGIGIGIGGSCPSFLSLVSSAPGASLFSFAPHLHRFCFLVKGGPPVIFIHCPCSNSHPP